MSSTDSEPSGTAEAADSASRDAATTFEGDEGLSTQPAEPTLPSLGPVEMARWVWRQLTSMRIALLLLFLLSLAAIPGSLIPQRPTNPVGVSNYFKNHPSLAPILDRLQLFDVFTSYWFASIYVLLFISLVGCIVPRSWKHFQAMRAAPPVAPRNLARMPTYRRYSSDTAPDEALDAARTVLRGRRFRTVRGAGWVSAEKGYLRESGNLLFHVALLGLLVALGYGAAFGYSASVLVTEGSGYADTITQFDNYSAGPLFQASDLPPYTITLDHFDASYQTTGTQIGAPRSYEAQLTVRDTPTSAPRQVNLQVNHPLSFGTTKVFLQGHGYSPIFTVKDGHGDVVYDGPTPFLPQDADDDSTGVVKVPDAQPQQLGFSGLFLPTAYLGPAGFESVFPAAQNPEVVLLAYQGNLGLDNGAAQNVYVLDTQQLKKIEVNGQPFTKALTVGQTMTLPDNLGSITFNGYRQWVNFQITSNPGTLPAGLAAGTAVLGLILSLRVRRRRVWVRVRAADGDRSVIEIGGLARTETGDLDQDVERVTAALLEQVPAREVSVEEAAPDGSASGNGASGNGASGDGASGDGTPGDGTAGDTAGGDTALAADRTR